LASSAYVVDSCVVIRWYLEQVGFEHAREIRDEFWVGTTQLSAPDVVRWEVANVLRKKGFLAGLLTEDDLVDAVSSLDQLGLVVHHTDGPTMERVTRLSVTRGISPFDAAYVELALRTGLPLLTSDGRLARAVGDVLSTDLLRGSTA
jgi:predicted nucleic acid-binding protein